MFFSFTRQRYTDLSVYISDLFNPDILEARQHGSRPDKMNKNVLYRIALLITNTL
nr:hypothetical protein [Elizabethkingia sp. ASV34]